MTTVYRCFDAGGQLLYVGISTSAKRFGQHKNGKAWWRDVARIDRGSDGAAAAVRRLVRLLLLGFQSDRRRRMIVRFMAAGEQIGLDVDLKGVPARGDEVDGAIWGNAKEFGRVRDRRWVALDPPRGIARVELNIEVFIVPDEEGS